ncbi:MAG: endonuclease [Candidatus Aenigmarchaeota archaeon]|nr:endonuclease [Candidatus Aenigmarchaeota archaeon]
MNTLLFFIVVSIIELVAIVYLVNKWFSTASRKQSLSTTYGKIFEQIVPFSKRFSFEPKNFRFIGDPIDGLAFTDNEVVFCEIKLNKSTLSKRQKRIKELVQKKKVRWQEIRGD